MERYFDKFQTITYENRVVRDITQRTVLLNSVYNNPVLYYPYDIADGERPDMIADRYYSDQYMSWLLYLSNNVIDPYHDWYVDQTTFEQFIVKKYGSLASAMSRIKYFRNNWYSDTSPRISSTTYDGLDPGVKKYYEPEEVNGIVPASPRFYVRRKEDWTVETNAIARYTVNTATEFTTDEVVDIDFGSGQTGRGQFTYASNTSVVLKNLVGTTTAGTITGSSKLTGRESKETVQFTAANSVTSTIPGNESQYWSSVTYYDYETEINERNKSILVLKSQYASSAARQLRDILR